jgi:hypothetical protein
VAPKYSRTMFSTQFPEGYKFGYQSRSGTGQSSLSLCFLGEAALAKSFAWLDGHSSRIMSSFGKSLKHRELPVLHVRVFLSRTLTWDKDHACDLLSSVMSFVVLLFCCVFLMENMLLSTDWKYLATKLTLNPKADIIIGSPSYQAVFYRMGPCSHIVLYKNHGQTSSHLMRGVVDIISCLLLPLCFTGGFVVNSFCKCQL